MVAENEPEAYVGVAAGLAWGSWSAVGPVQQNCTRQRRSGMGGFSRRKTSSVVAIHFSVPLR